MLISAAPTNAAGDITESESVLRNAFRTGRPGTGFLARNQAGVSSAEVCFDRCDVFQWTGSPHKAGVWDFIALYVHKVGFASEADIFSNNAQALLPVIQRASIYCRTRSKDPLDFDCDWSEYAKAQFIRVGIAAYDEGLRCFAWRDRESLSFPKKTRCDPIKDSPWKARTK
jgi:hypothetical protein